MQNREVESTEENYLRDKPIVVHASTARSHLLWSSVMRMPTDIVACIPTTTTVKLQHEGKHHDNSWTGHRGALLNNWRTFCCGSCVLELLKSLSE